MSGNKTKATEEEDFKEAYMNECIVKNVFTSSQFSCKINIISIYSFIHSFAVQYNKVTSLCYIKLKVHCFCSANSMQLNKYNSMQLNKSIN